MNRQLSMFDSPAQPKPPPTFERMKPENPMEDRWPPHTFTQNVTQAYKRAEEDGLIYIEKIFISRSTHSAVVRYLSAVPVPEWMHEILREYKTKE